MTSAPEPSPRPKPTSTLARTGRQNGEIGEECHRGENGLRYGCETAIPESVLGPRATCPLGGSLDRFIRDSPVREALGWFVADALEVLLIRSFPGYGVLESSKAHLPTVIGHPESGTGRGGDDGVPFSSLTVPGNGNPRKGPGLRTNRPTEAGPAVPGERRVRFWWAPSTWMITPTDSPPKSGWARPARAAISTGT